MKNFFLTTLLLTFFTLPLFIFAQTEYTLLEPSVYNGTYNTTGGKPFSDYLNLVFKIGIGVAAGLAVVQIVIGGIQYMASESPFKIGDAKSKIEGAILGLILALGIYVFLYTINPDIVSLKLDIIKPPTGAPSSGITTRAVSATEEENQKKLEEILKDDKNIRDKLLAVGVGVNSNACQTYGQKRCTTVGLLPTRVVAQLKALADACGCIIVVSGGTEWWLHATHGPKLPIVDIRKNPALDRWVKNKDLSTLREVGITTKKTYIKQIPSGGGGHFYDEDPLHYHVTFF